MSFLLLLPALLFIVERAIANKIDKIERVSSKIENEKKTKFKIYLHCFDLKMCEKKI